jgi:hypothetical protein
MIETFCGNNIGRGGEKICCIRRTHNCSVNYTHTIGSNTTVTTMRDCHGNHNSWLLIQLICNVFVRPTIFDHVQWINVVVYMSFTVLHSSDLLDKWKDLQNNLFCLNFKTLGTLTPNWNIIFQMLDLIWQRTPYEASFLESMTNHRYQFYFLTWLTRKLDQNWQGTSDGENTNEF